MRIFRNETLDEKALRTLTQDELDWVYNALDVCVTFEVHDRILESPTLDDIALNTSAFSHSLAAPVLEMNLRGTFIDQRQRQEVLVKFREMRTKVEADFLRIIYEGVGVSPPFNYRATGQLKWLFYKVLGLKPILARNSNGDWAPTVNREAIEKLAEYAVCRVPCHQLLSLRELDKRIQFLETEIDADGRMRTSFNVAGTNTGRLSSAASDEGSGGNQQNIERLLRRCYIPDPGWKFCNIDLEQGDSRNVGAICWQLFVESHGESFAGSYLDACESGDLHTSVCRMAWKELPWTENRKANRALADEIAYRSLSFRDMAKKLGHGTNYYGTPRTMAAHTKVETDKVREFQIKYFAGFPVLGSFTEGKAEKKRALEIGQNWHSWVYKQINEFGYLTTPFYSRRRYFFGRPDDDATLREAIAYSPQSMTADAIDTALIRLWRWGKVLILIQVHDSLLLQYRPEAEEEIIPQILEIASVRHVLKKGRPFLVPAEAKVGWNWGDVEYNKDGSIKDNPDGLIKWRGTRDERPRPKLILPEKRSLQALLNAR